MVESIKEMLEGKESQIEELLMRFRYSQFCTENPIKDVFTIKGLRFINIQCYKCCRIFCRADDLAADKIKFEVYVDECQKEKYRYVCSYCNKSYRYRVQTQQHLLQHIICKQILCKKCLQENVDSNSVSLMPLEECFENALCLYKYKPTIVQNSNMAASALVSVNCGRCQKLFLRGDEFVEIYLDEMYRNINPENILKLAKYWKCLLCNTIMDMKEENTQLTLHEHLWMHMISDEIFCDNCQQEKP
ncbi:uncharacterized protein LOC111619730 [Centruroides sculpturatus]|uniref:uncharacterized protein LOC111619730 n=1 Tax=Centruroides sculpturatus TaxID=218467 RepID=UPI000C6EC183|nr:uncharacterized protein LOC111619730 [Centruroides sculpturatus]